MKKLLLAGAVCFSLSFELSAQTIENKKSAVKQGDNTINLYYGTNVLGAIYKRVAADAAENIVVKSFGPVGIVYEHLVTDMIGLGAEFGYSHTNLDYYETYPSYNSQGQVNERYGYHLKFTTIRVMFRANFHFAESEKFDAYGLISAGYRTTKFEYSTDNNYDNSNLHFNSLIPFGIKPGIGLRYFFTQNIGLNLEIAAGTPLICGGITFKF